MNFVLRFMLTGANPSTESHRCWVVIHSPACPPGVHAASLSGTDIMRPTVCSPKVSPGTTLPTWWNSTLTTSTDFHLMCSQHCLETFLVYLFNIIFEESLLLIKTYQCRSGQGEDRVCITEFCEKR